MNKTKKQRENIIEIPGFMPGAVWVIDLDLVVDKDKREFCKAYSQHVQSIKEVVNIGIK